MDKSNEIAELKEYLIKIEGYTLLAAKNVLCFDDVVLLTGLSKSYLYKLTCTHQIPCYKPNGKMMYFDRGELEAWMKQNRQNTRQEAAQAAAYYDAAKSQKGGCL